MAASEIKSQSEALRSLVPLSKIMEAEHQKQNIHFTSMNTETALRNGISTGLLSVDLIMGGGQAPGTFSSFFGPTGSCKSTILYQTFREAVNRNINVVFYDYESSTDPSYLEKLEFQLSDVMGFRNKKGEWEKDPRFWITSGSTLEACFRAMHHVLKQLPDKVMMMDGDEIRWFLIKPDYKYTLSWQSINKGLKDKQIFEVEDGSPQAIFAIDSLAAMIPEAQDEDLDKAAMAGLARGLHKGFKWVKSLLGKKTCNLLATNHVTINPMAMFSNPETEPGGKAVEFYPDAKIRMEVFRSKSRTIEEPNVEAGIDRYFEGKLFIKKNKRGPSYREIEYRLWADEAGDPGRGICPVFDLHQFLRHTNQLGFEGKSEKEFKVLVDGFTAEPYTWHTFKKMALSEEGAKLKKACREQLRQGKAQEAYYQYIKEDATTAKKSKKSKKVEEENPEPTLDEDTLDVTDIEI